MLKMLLNSLKSCLRNYIFVFVFFLMLLNVLSFVCVSQSESPSAVLSISSEIAEVSETVVFDASASKLGSGSNLSYEIDFGDGSSDTSSSSGRFTHSYDDYGEYTISLTVSNSFGSSTTTDSITIIPSKPIAFMSVKADGKSYTTNGFNPDVIAGVTRVSFSADESIDTDLTQSGLSYRFYFGDGTDSDWQDSSSSSHVYEDKGSFSSYLKVKNESGEVSDASEEVIIEVISSLRPAIIAKNDRAKEVPFTTIFDISGCKDLDTDNEIVKYVVDFGDGTPVYTNSSATPVKHTYSREGEFHAKVTITNDDGETASAIAIIKLGGALMWEMIGNGALWIGIIGAILGFVFGIFDYAEFPETIILAVIGGIVGAIAGAILGFFWYHWEWWTILGLGIFVFILYIIFDGGFYYSGGGSYGSGGWYGDSEGHSEAAKKGWRNRR